MSQSDDVLYRKRSKVKEGNYSRFEGAYLEKHTDPEVWERFVAGDELAFSYIYGKYVDFLYNFGCQYTEDRELVKDTIQDLFLRLKHSGTQSKITSIKSYLCKCFYRDLIKKLKKERNWNLEGLDFAPFGITMSEEVKWIKNQLDRERKYQLNKSLDQLSLRQRQVVLLYYYEGLSYKEIANIFEMKNPKYARKLLYRAIDKLKILIEPKNILF